MNRNVCPVIFALVFIVAGVTAFASPSIVKPNKNQVVIVGRCVTGPALDEDFYAALLLPPRAARSVNSVALKDDGNMHKKTENLVAEGDFFFVTYNLPKDRTITIPYFTFSLFNRMEGAVVLPLNVKITVPEGQQYLYIGSFVYEFADFHFNIADIANVDEYEDASAMLNKALRKETQLYRAVLQYISSEDSEESEEN